MSCLHSTQNTCRPKVGTCAWGLPCSAPTGQRGQARYSHRQAVRRAATRLFATRLFTTRLFTTRLFVPGLGLEPRLTGPEPAVLPIRRSRKARRLSAARRTIVEMSGGDNMNDRVWRGHYPPGCGSPSAIATWIRPSCAPITTSSSRLRPRTPPAHMPCRAPSCGVRSKSTVLSPCPARS